MRILFLALLVYGSANPPLAKAAPTEKPEPSSRVVKTTTSNASAAKPEPSARVVKTTVSAANEAKKSTLSPIEQQMVNWVAEREAQLISELVKQVAINTGTDNIEGINHYRAYLRERLTALGFTTREVSSEPIATLSCAGGQVAIADHLVATRSGQGPKLWLNGHMDTVFSADDEFQRMTVMDDGTIKGPGVADMKGGIEVMLTALEALQQVGLLGGRNITVLLNSDEEIGSLGSRPLIEQLAAEHDLGVVFEGSYRNHLARSRKGLGQARIKITGREAHAGAAHEDGVSASLELAHKVVALEALTDYASQSTVNVGVMAGGEKRNTIPGCAEAYVDLRFVSAAEGQALQQQVLDIAERTYAPSDRFPAYPHTESWSVLHRPAKPVSTEVDSMIALAMELSSHIGEPIEGALQSGGGTDGSIAQAVGLPTLDSLGVDGSGAHSSREATSIASLVARSQLAAVMLARLLYPDE